jgi:fluoride exporter
MGMATTGFLDPAILSLFGPGFCGGLTTYSTFRYETLRLAEDGSRFLAGVNIAISLLAGLGAAFIGFAIAAAL